MKSLEEQLNLIKRGTVEIIQQDELKKKLEHSVKTKKPLIIKAGFDPTAPDIHLGHTVLLRKLKHFQDLGHKVIFLIGDFTAIIGDPSGQSQTRKTLTFDEVNKNVKTYLKQVGKVLRLDKKVFEVRYNSEWFGKGTSSTTMVLTEFLRKIAAKYTVARLIERDDFSKRLRENKPLTVLELLYPLMQGYDSVVLKADVELGGTDQKFNLLVGRDLQRDFNQEPQVVITMPLLVGTDGVDKMSKSLDNYIGIEEDPKDIFGKTMSISDELMLKYYELLTDEPLNRLKSDLKSGRLHPKEAKKKLAKIIIIEYYGSKDAKRAEADFEQRFKHKEFPNNEPLKIIRMREEIPILANQLSEIMGMSKSEIRRKVNEKAVKIDGNRVTNIEPTATPLKPGREYKIRIGKRFARVKYEPIIRRK
ncbi:MAG: tyrosine--tRNA ligase [Candidatus Omnitrophica bacterium]|nr:tyrosine--tRNA ligase [Candidatus Omnitrophota bacterium]